jgi:hypothetical protein
MVMCHEENAGKKISPEKSSKVQIFVNNSDNIEIAFMKKLRAQ